jgi:hypothetical protein
MHIRDNGGWIMKENQNRKSWMGILILLVVGISFLVYRMNRENAIEKQPDPQDQKGTIREQMNLALTDEELTAQLKMEEGVFFALVTYHPRIVFAAVTVENGVTTERGEEIANLFMNRLTQKYPKAERSIQIKNRDGEQVFGLREEES